MIVKFEIVHTIPPMFDRILAVFPQAANHGVLFCWGHEIYNPSKVDVPDYLIAHENVHRLQQNGEPAFWWEKYLVDREFRLAQEIPAHQAEYQAYSRDFGNRNLRRLHLKAEAERLSGPLYGNLISFGRARTIIKEKIHEASV